MGDSLIVVAAIVVWGGGRVLSNYLNHQKEMALLRIQSGGSTDAGLRDEVDRLRRELMSLRETSGQYDMSLQHVQESLEERVNHLETKLRTNSAVQTAGEQQIRAGQNSD